jgi:hypothetical protein
MQDATSTALSSRMLIQRIIFCTTYRPSTAGMEARTRRRTLPAVG